MKHRTLTHALAVQHAGSMLAIAPSAFGRAYAFPDEHEPAAFELVEATGVAIVDICGPLSQRAFAGMCGAVDGYDAITARFIEAIDHPDVEAVVLRIDSPGGACAGLFEAVRRMSEARDLAGKRVFAFADECAASAAYALACVALDGIYLPASGEIGSVGVLDIHADHSAANEEEGVRFTIVRSGERKAEGNPLEPLSAAALAAMQERVETIAGVFFNHVAASRGMTSEAVRGFEGAVFSAAPAVENGLATGIASLEEVIALAASSIAGDAEEAEEEAEPANDEDEPLPPLAARSRARIEARRAEAVALRAEVARRERRDQAASLVNVAVKERRLSVRQRAAMIDLGESAGVDGLRAALAALPVRPPWKALPKREVGGLSAMDQAVALSLGVAAEDFAAQRAAFEEGDATR